MAAGCGCYVAVLVLFVSFVIFVAFRLTDNPSDPEVDYDAVSLFTVINFISRHVSKLFELISIN